MFELTINGVPYMFNFGMGFMRKINKKVGTPVDGLPDVKKNIGLRYYIAGIIDKDPEALYEVLILANEGQNPRLLPTVLDAHIDDATTDIDAMFATVLDFLRNTNATKNTVEMILEAADRQKNQK